MIDTDFHCDNDLHLGIWSIINKQASKLVKNPSVDHPVNSSIIRCWCICGNDTRSLRIANSFLEGAACRCYNKLLLIRDQ